MNIQQMSFPFIPAERADKEREYMSVSFDRITVSHDETDCYFHFYGDNCKYFDLESIEERHPDQKDYLVQHRYELLRSIQQLRELIEEQNGERIGAIS